MVTKIEDVKLDFFCPDDPFITVAQWKEQILFAAEMLDVVCNMLPLEHREIPRIKKIATSLRADPKVTQ